MANYNFIESTGTIVPDTSTTRESVVVEFRGVFGQDLITDDETPEGAWINAETTSRQSVARNNANLANQINPNLAGGPFLDAIWALTGGGRTTATRSTVTATVTGIANTQIPAATRAATTDGNQFRAVNTITIPISGTATGAAFESVDTGPVAGGVNTLTNIVDAVLGWETITNPTAAIPGVAQESDEDSRNRRRRTLGLQGRSVAAAVTANLTAIPGVRSLAFRENITNTTMVVDGISLLPHSVWACVDGGADVAIAGALLRSKTAGANWNGAQSQAVTEPVSGQSYTVRFDRPTVTQIAVRATVRRTSNVADPITAVRDSVVRYANGLIPGEEGFVVSGDVSPFELSAAVNRDNPAIFVSRCEVAVASQTPAYSTDTLLIPTNGVARVNPTDVLVVIT